MLCTDARPGCHLPDHTVGLYCWTPLAAVGPGSAAPLSDPTVRLCCRISRCQTPLSDPTVAVHPICIAYAQTLVYESEKTCVYV